MVTATLPAVMVCDLRFIGWDWEPAQHLQGNNSAELTSDRPAGLPRQGGEARPNTVIQCERTAMWPLRVHL
jgi:hypothetical protein